MKEEIWKKPKYNKTKDQRDQPENQVNKRKKKELF